MPRNSELNVADLSGEAAITGEIPTFDLDHDVGANASGFVDDAHVIDVEVTPAKPVKRKRVGLILGLALVACVVVIAAYLHSGKKKSALAENPDLASIIKEAKSVPPLAGRTIDSLPPASKAMALAKTAPATGAPKAIEPPAAATSSPTKAAPIAMRSAAAAIASSVPSPAAAPHEAVELHVSAQRDNGQGVVSKAKYDALVTQRDSIAKQRDDALLKLHTLESTEAAAKNAHPVEKEVVRVPVHERSVFTVKAVLADGVVLQDSAGKAVVAPTGARVLVDGKFMELTR
ncbi:hypothetical protein AB7849_15295 [Rhodanobacter sp. 115]|uniref:hypothetical protein n=1 Tax=Rhodanobacter sp. FW021-MT20 TaxID=1162282 RepID=UPI0034E4B71A